MKTFEFKTDINPDDVVDYAYSTDRLVISDDTQMALFGFEALHHAKSGSGDMRDIIRNEFTTSYIDWYKTQTESYSHYDYSGLLSIPCMYSVQSPGNTCLDSIYELKKGNKVVNDSKGCGSVMRLLPIVKLFDPVYKFTEEEVIEFAQITGDITHKHEENAHAIEMYMIAAKSLISREPIPHWSQYKHISDIGSGWTALECVEMAIWAFTKAKNFDDLLRLSVAHDGDSDSVAAVAGSLWGLSNRKWPVNMLFKLDAFDAINYVAGDFKD